MPRAALRGPHPCPVCGAGPFSTIRSLSYHLMAQHPELGPRGRTEALDRLRWPGSAGPAA
jgi:hypothetical protein